MTDPIHIDEALRTVIADAQAASESAMTPERLAEYDRAEARQRRRELLDASAPAITPEARRAIIAGDEPERRTHSLSLVRRWHATRVQGRGWPRVLVLCGGTGSGKTVASAWMLAREPGRYVIAPDAVRQQRTGVVEWHRTTRAHLLVLDDVGTHTEVEHERAMFFELVNARVAAGWTLCTTNMTVEAFRAWLDPRTASRLAQIGHVQDVTGPDLRAQPAQQVPT